jgi:metal-responsive CopG/Arc/MetJ family transcriptional regulator
VQPQKRRGPAPTGKGHPVQVRLQPDLLVPLDEWIARQPEHRSRPDAIRDLLEQALSHSRPRPAGAHKGASRARELAANAVDHASDASATDEQRQRRKRRILKGPPEFREIRKDLPKRPK